MSQTVKFSQCLTEPTVTYNFHIHSSYKGISVTDPVWCFLFANSFDTGGTKRNNDEPENVEGEAEINVSQASTYNIIDTSLSLVLFFWFSIQFYRSKLNSSVLQSSDNASPEHDMKVH
jgi:hypothetical protein